MYILFIPGQIFFADQPTKGIQKSSPPEKPSGLSIEYLKNAYSNPSYFRYKRSDF